MDDDGAIKSRKIPKSSRAVMWSMDTKELINEKAGYHQESPINKERGSA